MHFKMIIAFVEDSKTDAVLDAAREKGATGATIIHNARGEGLKVSKTFFGLSLETPARRGANAGGGTHEPDYS